VLLTQTAHSSILTFGFSGQHWSSYSQFNRKGNKSQKIFPQHDDTSILSGRYLYMTLVEIVPMIESFVSRKREKIRPFNAQMSITFFPADFLCFPNFLATQNRFCAPYLSSFEKQARFFFRKLSQAYLLI
jgi:hypothetical protein